MGLESTASLSTIAGFNIAWPIHATDPFSEIADHISNIKLATYRTFPNMGSEMSANAVTLNKLKGLTSSFQEQLSGKAAPPTAYAAIYIGNSRLFISSDTPADTAQNDIWLKKGS